MARKDCKDRGLFQRPKGSGIWWIDYVGPDRREHCERGGTKTEARNLLARRKTEIVDGVWQRPHGHGIHASNRSHETADESRTTLGAFARAWLKERAPHLTPAVREDYERLLRFHLFSDPLARKPLADIDDGDLARLVNKLREKRTRSGRSLSPRRINMVIARLRTIFATARPGTGGKKTLQRAWCGTGAPPTRIASWNSPWHVGRAKWIRTVGAVACP